MPSLILSIATLSTALTIAVLSGAPESAPPADKPAPPCNPALSRAMSNPLVVTNNTSDNGASWFIKNNGTSALTLTGQSASRTGNVTSVTANNWVPFPYALAAGAQIDADVLFDVGAAGTGTVSLSVSSSCGTLSLPTFSVTIN